MKQVYYILAPWHFVGFLLVFIVLVPTSLVLTYKYQEEAGMHGCGNVTPPAPLPDEDTAAETLFQQACASCHNPIKDATGPALAGILDGRREGFLYRFLVKRKAIRNDKLVRKRIAQYILECPQFTYLTKEDVARLEGFIKRKSLL